MATATISATPAAAPPAHQGSSYRPDIDGLRAVAIISVVAFHTRLAGFTGGFIGVDVFLVISGYLIGSLVYRDVSESRFSLLHFYERRAKRILPALLTVLFVCNLIAFVLLSPLELRGYCAQSFSAVTSTSNIYYWLRSNYFNPVTALKPLLMTWSLGIEEQFYLLFPLALFLLHKVARRRVFHFLALGCAASFVVCEVCVRQYPSAAFYLLPMRAWELGLGVLIAVYEVQRERPARLSNAITNVLGCIGIALILVPVLVYTESTRFPGLAALLPTAGAACLIQSRNSFVNRRLLASRPMVFVGLISYSWYLWHWPLLSFARIVTGNLLSVPRAVSIAIFALILSVFSHRFVEQPFRKSTTPTLRLLAGYATALVIMGAIPLVGHLQRGWPGRVPELVKAEAAVDATHRNVCMAGFEEASLRLKAPCVVDGDPKLAVLGDSHAASLGPALHDIAVHHGYGFELLAKASCPPLTAARRRWALHPALEQTCVDFNQAAFQRVVSDRSVTVVVLAGLWSSLCSADNLNDCSLDDSQPGKKDAGAERDQNLHAGLLKEIQILRSSGKRVFVATDVPRFDPDPLSIVRNSVIKPRGELAALLSSLAFSLDAVDEASLIKPADAISDREVRQAASEGGAQIIDLARNLCPASRCRFWDNGILLYADPTHLTRAGADYALRGQDPISTAEEQTVASKGPAAIP